MNTAAPPVSQPRFALGHLIAAVLCFWGMSHLWWMNQTGRHELAGIGAIITALLGGRFVLNAASAHWASRRTKKALGAAQSLIKTEGKARFATNTDTKRAGMHRPGGFFLGALNGRDLYSPGAGSNFVFAPPRTGKGVCSVVPNLLQKHTDERGRPVSLFVLDVKGELFAVTSKRMEALGYEVVCINPWAEKMSRELGIEMPDHGFNPTLPLLDAGKETKDATEFLASLILPGSASESGSGAYFTDFGRSINAWGLMVLARRGDPSLMNLVSLRNLLMSSPEELDQLLAETAHCDDFGGALRQYANKLLSTRADAGEEWSGAINTATKALQVFDAFGPLGEHVSATNGFDFRTIKKRPTCVYLVIPSERVTTHQTWLNLVLSTAIEQMGEDRTTKRVLCLFDEFANAGYLPNVLKAIGLYAGQGIQFAFYTQTASQIRRLYGDDGLRDFLGMCETVQAFGVRDPETLKMLSELAGHDTTKVFSQNLSPDPRGQNPLGFSTTASQQGHAILRSEDIRTLDEDRQLIFFKNLPPILADKVSYLRRRRWRRWASKNPYHRD